MSKPQRIKSSGRNFSKAQRGYSDRNLTRGHRGKPNRRFLIVCEGTQTEPNYFEALGRKIKGKVNLIIKREGKVSLSLVKEAQKLKDEDGGYDQGQNEDEVWCVFDRDFKPENNNQQNFNQAIILAYNNKINLAISNDAFELWFLLHFSYHCSRTHRNDFKNMLTDKIGEKYHKNNPQLYDQLEPYQDKAIKYAGKLWNSHDEQISTSISEVDKLIKKHNINPSTTVYKLVDKLIKYLEE